MEGPRTFRDWLGAALEGEGETIRGLAKKIAEKHPEGANSSTIESARTSLRKILHGKSNPTQPTRDAIQQALGRDDAPTVEDEAEDEPVSREMVLDELRRLRRNSLRLERALTNGRLV